MMAFMGRGSLWSLDFSQAGLAGFQDAFGTVAASTTEPGDGQVPGYCPSETSSWVWLLGLGVSA